MYKRILVPVDGSALSEQAVRSSVDLARQLGATLVGFVAEPMAPLPVTPRTASAIEQELAEHDAMTEAHAEPVLARFEAAARSAGVPFEGHYDRVPRIDRAIVEAAESHGCDLIVMATHGRGAFGEFLFGSQTKAVLANTRLPLLVLH
jgi:nucleotide-binding universal stress UspA family protein